MTAEQITDLAALLRVVPESLEDWKMDEETIMECEKRSGYLDDPNLDDIRQEYLHLHMLATSQYMIGMFEESILSITRAIQSLQYFMLKYSRQATPKQVKMFGTSDTTSLAEMYTQLANNFVYTFHWQEAEWCYKLAYRDLKFFEKEDWKDYEYMYQPKGTRTREGQDRRCIYLNWAWSIAQLYIKDNRKELAITILEKAEMVAADMNRKEDGRWSAKLELINAKISQLYFSIIPCL